MNESDPSAELRGTPLWLWAILLVILVGGAFLAYSMAPGGGAGTADDHLLDTLSVAPWDDLESDPLVSPEEGLGDLDAPLLPDTSGGAPEV